MPVYLPSLVANTFAKGTFVNDVSMFALELLEVQNKPEAREKLWRRAKSLQVALSQPIGHGGDNGGLCIWEG